MEPALDTTDTTEKDKLIEVSLSPFYVEYVEFPETNSTFQQKNFPGKF